MGKIETSSTITNKIKRFITYPCWWFKIRFPVYMDSTESRWGTFSILLSLCVSFLALSVSFFVGGTLVPATFPITSFQLAIAFAIFGVIFGALAIILAAYFLKHPRHDQINSDIAAMKGDMVTIKEDINAIRGEIPSITTELKNINQTLKKMSGSNNNEL